MLVGYANQTARLGTLLQSASTPTLSVLRSRLLRRMDKRPSLLLARRLSGGSAWTEGCGFHWPIAMQTTTRAAAWSSGFFIRKMRPFEESHTFASHKYAVVEHPDGLLNTKPRPLGRDSLLLSNWEDFD